MSFILTEGGQRECMHALSRLIAHPQLTHHFYPKPSPAASLQIIRTKPTPARREYPRKFRSGGRLAQTNGKGGTTGGIMQCLERAPPKRRLPAA